MKNISSLSHTAWDCKYHLVWVPKYRKAILYGQLRKYLGEIFRDLALHKESQIHEGHLMGDHVHMMISIPPKYSVSQVVGYIKGKSAINIARRYMGHERNFTGQIFGPEVIMYQQPVEMRRSYVSTSKNSKNSIRSSTK